MHGPTDGRGRLQVYVQHFGTVESGSEEIGGEVMEWGTTRAVRRTRRNASQLACLPACLIVNPLLA